MVAWRAGYPIHGVFRISRGAKTEAEVVEVAIQDGDVIGRGERVPYSRHGQTVEGVLGEIRAAGGLVRSGVGIAELQSRLPAGPARNAIECALWDLQARSAPRFVVAQRAELVHLDGPMLLDRDRTPGLRYVGAEVQLTGEELWAA
jgi:L-alanine-DL-glutamate epimerase-like enolase superfamily enzyme